MNNIICLVILVIMDQASSQILDKKLASKGQKFVHSKIFSGIQEKYQDHKIKKKSEVDLYFSDALVSSQDLVYIYFFNKDHNKLVNDLPKSHELSVKLSKRL